MLLDLLKRLFKGVFTLLLIAGPLYAYAQAEQYPAQVTSTGAGTGYIEADLSTLYQQGFTNRADRNFTTVPEFVVSENATHCYPRSGGSAGIPNGVATIANLNSASHQTSNTSGGSPNCAGSGTYYIQWYVYPGPQVPNYDCGGSQGGKCIYFSYYYNADLNQFSNAEFGYVGNIDPGQYDPANVTPWDTEYIDINKPIFGTTTASTTVDIEVYFSTPFTFDFRPTTTRTVAIYDAVTGALEWAYNVQIPANAGETFLLSTTTVLSQGSKDIQAYYSTLDGVVYSDVAQSFFNVITNTYLEATGIENPLQKPQAIDCETFDIACQFQRALVFTFVPTPGVLDKFSNLWQTLRTKIPFGYVTVTIDQLSAFDTNEAGAYDLGTLPFMDSIFTPIKTLLSTILWGIFAIWFYHARLKKIEI